MGFPSRMPGYKISSHPLETPGVRNTLAWLAACGGILITRECEVTVLILFLGRGLVEESTVERGLGQAGCK